MSSTNTSKNIVIVGANRGIGLEFARQLSADKNNQVFALCRKASPQLKELPLRLIENCEVTDIHSLKATAQQLPDSVDWLIHVAGILRRDSLKELNFPEIEEQLRVNSLGPLMTTSVLLPKLAEGSKIAFLSSRMGSVADNTSGAYYGYRSSKAALNMMGVSLAHDLKPQGITVLLLHPGYVQTDMTDHHGDIDASTSAERMIQLIAEKGLADSGRFFHSNGQELPW